MALTVEQRRTILSLANTSARNSLSMERHKKVQEFIDYIEALITEAESRAVEGFTIRRTRKGYWVVDTPDGMIRCNHAEDALIFLQKVFELKALSQVSSEKGENEN